MFVAIDKGLLVTCDSWAGRSGGAAACEVDGPGVSEDGVGSGDCGLDSLDRKKSLNLGGISIRIPATLPFEERKKCVRNCHSCAPQIRRAVAQIRRENTRLTDWADRPIT